MATATKAKTSKTTKTEATAKAEKPAKAAATALNPFDVLKPGAKKRDKSGTKQKVYDMVTRKGITYRALLTAAEKEGMPMARVKLWIPSWVRRGYLAID